MEKKETESKSESKNKVTGEDIAQYAQKFLGYKYVYGGASPSGFDCSGLVYYVYKQFGYKLSRASTAQAKEGKEFAKKDLKPGDVLIFKNNALTKIGHVGIYIGNGQIVHASTPSSGIKIGSATYREILAVRRIIN